MASGCRVHEFTDVAYLNLCITESFPSIEADITSAFSGRPTYNGTYFEWTLSLQRRENGVWTTIGTRTGFTSIDSPSYREFTNVANRGVFRLKLIGNHGGIKFTAYSPTV